LSGLPPKRDPLEEFAAQLAKGKVGPASRTVRDYADLLRGHLLAFIGRRDYIEQVKEDRRSPEWQLYQEYIGDERLSILAQMGLTLREWQNDLARAKDIERLRNRIRFKYGEEGLHIAQVVQSSVLTGVVPTVVESVSSKERAARLVEAFLAGSVSLCRFVQEKDQPGAVARFVTEHITRNRPPLFVLFARGGAIPICNMAVKQIIEGRRDFVPKVHDIQGSRIVVLVRSDIQARSTTY
jgi:hypothetical protein